VVLGVKLAIERVLPFVHAEGADPTCVFTAYLTLPEWCLVLAQEAVRCGPLSRSGYGVGIRSALPAVFQTDREGRERGVLSVELRERR
jgi:hypothetical protein